MLAPGRESCDKPRQIIKKQSHLLTKVCISQSYGISSSHLWMWELDYKVGWAPKNWCLWIVELEKTLESSLDCNGIKLVSPLRNQPWVFSGRIHAEAPILWPPDVKNWLTEKDPDAGKDWRQKKAAAEDEKVRQQHWLNGHEFEQTLVL